MHIVNLSWLCAIPPKGLWRSVRALHKWSAQKKAIVEKMKTKLERPITLPRMPHHVDGMAAERVTRSIKKR